MHTSNTKVYTQKTCQQRAKSYKTKVMIRRGKRKKKPKRSDPGSANYNNDHIHTNHLMTQHEQQGLSNSNAFRKGSALKRRSHPIQPHPRLESGVSPWRTTRTCLYGSGREETWENTAPRCFPFFSLQLLRLRLPEQVSDSVLVCGGHHYAASIC